MMEFPHCMQRPPLLHIHFTKVSDLVWMVPMKLTKHFLIEPYNTFIMKVNLSFPHHISGYCNFRHANEITMGRQ